MIIQSSRASPSRPPRRRPRHPQRREALTTTSAGSPSWGWTTSTRSAARTPRSARWSPTSPTSASACPTASPPPPTRSCASSTSTGLAERIAERLKDLDTDDIRRLAEAGREIRGGSTSTRSPTTSRPTSARPTTSWWRSRRDGGAVVRRTLLGHRGGPARRLLRRPAGDLPQRARHRRGAAVDPRGLRLALQRPRDQLPRAPRLRPRRRRHLRRRAEDGPLRRRRLRRDVHDGHRVGLPRRGVHHLGVRPGGGGRAGRGQPRRVLRLQARAARRPARPCSSAASAARPPR